MASTCMPSGASPWRSRSRRAIVLLAIVVAAVAVTACGGGSGGGGGASTTTASVVVPDLVGLNADDATARICAAGLAPGAPETIPGTEKNLTLAEINRRLRVVSSTPAPGATVPQRTRVTVTLKNPSNTTLVVAVQSCDAISAPPPWTIDLADVALGPTGLGMGLHPTVAPIAISVTSDTPLQVCPADAQGRPTRPGLSAWGRRWTACRALGPGTLELPRTDGRSHVGIRFLAVTRARVTVGRLRVRWACQDTYFRLSDPTGRMPTPVPRCA